MTTIHVDTRTFRLRLPALVLGRLGTAVVLQITEQVELRVERRPDRRAARRARAAQVDAALEDQRTRALAHRLGTL